MPAARILLTAAILTSTVGCAHNALYLTPAQLDRGLVIILPGIEGVSPLNRDIRRGLVVAGIEQAMPIQRWGTPIPGVGMLLNEMDFVGNRLAGRHVADMIVAYQEAHPGRPVHLIGHSGGGGIAVFAAESLPKGDKIDGVILLSASISCSYDMTKALEHCRQGVVNFYSKSDVGLLVIGTTIAGNVDGTHGPAAGAIGFDPPKDDARPQKQRAYQKLYQVQMTSEMTGGGSPHTSSTNVGFVARYVAPWVTAPSWPAGPAQRDLATRRPVASVCMSRTKMAEEPAVHRRLSVLR